MANGINNKYEYRSGLLDSLNVQHTASDVRNEDEYRKKVLNGLGVEYTEDDINQKNLYRAKVVEGLASSEGGGGESDFSTARVAILNASGKLVTFSPFARILGDEIDASPYNVMSVSTPQDCYAVLYRGQTYIAFDTEPPTTENIATEGGVEYDESDGTFIVTGDCTITIS